MGWWQTEHGTIGDTPADTLDEALQQIETDYMTAHGRLPTQGEMADLIQFCSCQTLIPACGKADFPFNKETIANDNVPRVGD